MAKKPTPSKTTARTSSTNDPRDKGQHPRLIRPRVHSIPPPPPISTTGGGGGSQPKRTTFDELLRKGAKQGFAPALGTPEARKWFRDTALKTRVSPTKLMTEEATELVAYPQIGNMYVFNYDPKHKLTLPYYDRYPLIFPIERAKGGFLGINLHYLPPRLRAKLMDALWEKSKPMVAETSDKNRLRVSYGILKEAAKFKAFHPCIKHYLANHVRSRFLKIAPYQWDMALMLPLARFEKATQEQVWRDSEALIRDL